jgi:mannose-6-phosphate isomerase-like protein (cupin superfamily)
MSLDLRHLPAVPDVVAPDGSAITLAAAGRRGSMVLCTLAPGQVTRAVVHRTVEELWYVVEGEGEVWRRLGQADGVVAIGPGTALTIPLGAHFQFRCLGSSPLSIIIATMPPWPGETEAVRVADYWPVDDA